MKRTMERPREARYRTFIEWIAVNDEPTCLDLETVHEQISVHLIADGFAVPATDVALDVIEERRRIERLADGQYSYGGP